MVRVVFQEGQEQSVFMVKVIPPERPPELMVEQTRQERVQRRVAEHTVAVPGPLILKENVEVVSWVLHEQISQRKSPFHKLVRSLSHVAHSILLLCLGF